jgi:hypothetical protein
MSRSVLSSISLATARAAVKLWLFISLRARAAGVLSLLSFPGMTLVTLGVTLATDSASPFLWLVNAVCDTVTLVTLLSPLLSISLSSLSPFLFVDLEEKIACHQHHQRHYGFVRYCWRTSNRSHSRRVVLR